MKKSELKAVIKEVIQEVDYRTAAAYRPVGVEHSISDKTLWQWRQLFSSAAGSGLMHSEKDDAFKAMRAIDSILAGETKS